MDRRTFFFLALVCLVTTLLAFACSGAEGDPAPVPVEAGEAATPACIDGALE
jgi:hypothetical protein